MGHRSRLFSLGGECYTTGMIELSAKGQRLATLLLVVWFVSGGVVAVTSLFALSRTNTALADSFVARRVVIVPTAQPISVSAISINQLPPVTLSAPTPPASSIEHQSMPSEVRGFYWTANTAGIPKRVSSLINFAKTNGLNAVVVDVKTDNGSLAFTPIDPTLAPYAPAHPVIQNLDALLAALKTAGLYRIARIPVMRDSVFASVNPTDALRSKDGTLWQDNLGMDWLDPAAPEVAANAIALAKEAYARGFDEVQFDYVRFPSDGGTGDIVYPVYNAKTQTKEAVMKKFFATLGAGLKPNNIPTSFDVFGVTCWFNNDQGIGQWLADVFPQATAAVSPMVYPSHFGDGFLGFANPADHPYALVNQSLNACQTRLAAETKSAPLLSKEGVGVVADTRSHFRPWIQDFNLGAKYGAAQVQQQIQAARDAGAGGFLIWNAGNDYDAGDYGLAKLSATTP